MCWFFWDTLLCRIVLAKSLLTPTFHWKVVQFPNYYSAHSRNWPYLLTGFFTVCTVDWLLFSLATHSSLIWNIAPLLSILWSFIPFVWLYSKFFFKENAAICDEIARLEEKFLKAKEERRWVGVTLCSESHFWWLIRCWCPWGFFPPSRFLYFAPATSVVQRNSQPVVLIHSNPGHVRLWWWNSALHLSNKTLWPHLISNLIITGLL